MPRRVAARIGRVLCSLELSCALLVLLGLLTWLGTLEQVELGLYAVQKKYFESFFVELHVGPVPLYLPGANLVLTLLFVNLIAGGVVRLRKGWSRAGILITHVGIACLLLGGFVKTYFSEDGHVTLFEGERASAFQSYQRFEIAIARDAESGRIEERVVPEERFVDADGDEPVTLIAAELPFDVEVRHFVRNARPVPAATSAAGGPPIVDGVLLRALPTSPEAEANIPGLHATLVERANGRRTVGLLWAAANEPWRVDVAGERWSIDLRKERYPMPFTLVLDDFEKEDHPRSDMPKSFASDVTVLEAGSSRPVRISMNQPLRHAGLVLYQASWGPSTARPGDPLFSTFAVVRNPADRLPIVACVVIALGLVVHFSRKLVLHVADEARRGARARVTPAPAHAPGEGGSA